MHTTTCSPPAGNGNPAIRRMALWGSFLALAFASVVADAITLTAVQSRKAHGASTFDVTVDTTQTIGGAVTVESRAIGSGHQIVFQFDGPVATHGTAVAIDETGATIGTLVPLISGNDVVVTLTNVPDNKRIKVVLPSVNGGADAVASLGFLVGDVNNSRSVSANDVQQMKARSGQVVDAGNFRFDLNASGVIGAADVIAVKSRSPLTLPAAYVPPTFTTQPINVIITEGQTAQFEAAVSGTPAPALQWQLSTDGGANWSDIPGANSSPLNIVAALSANGRRYRAVATSAAGSVNSNAATLTVNAVPLPKAWQAAQRISPAAFGDVYSYQIAFSANGDAMSVWESMTTAANGDILVDVLASHYTPSTGWEPAIAIDASPRFAGKPQIGMDDSGNAIAVFEQNDGAYGSLTEIWSNRYVAGTGWQGASVLAPSNIASVSGQQIAVAANGHAIVTWSQRNAANSGAETISRTYLPGSGWGGTTTLATGTDAIIIIGGFGVVGNPSSAKVSIDASGNTMAIWLQLVGTQMSLLASRNSGAPEVIKADVGLFLGSYQVASNASGETVVVWGQSCVMWANRYVPGTGWGTATTLQTVNPSCGAVPQVAVDTNGNAIAAWGRFGNRYNAGVGWLGASQINNGASFQFAMNAAGNTLAVWQSASILAGNSDYVAGYNFFPSVLVYGDSGLDASGLKIAMDANGNAIVLFKRGGDGLFGNTIWAAVYK